MLYGAIHHFNYFIKSTECAWRLEEMEPVGCFQNCKYWLIITSPGVLKTGVCSPTERGCIDNPGDRDLFFIPSHVLEGPSPCYVGAASQRAKEELSLMTAQFFASLLRDPVSVTCGGFFCGVDNLSTTHRTETSQTHSPGRC